jgi:hypothetical protein
MTNARPGTLINRCAGVQFVGQRASSSHAQTSICGRPQFNRIECRALCPSRSLVLLVLRDHVRHRRLCLLADCGLQRAACTHMRATALLGTPNSLQSTGCPSEERICGLRVSTVNARCSPPVAGSYRLSACTASLHCGTCVSRSSPCTAPHYVRCAAILCMIQPPIDVYPWRPVRCVSGGSMTPSSQRSVSPVSRSPNAAGELDRERANKHS